MVSLRERALVDRLDAQLGQVAAVVDDRSAQVLLRVSRAIEAWRVNDLTEAERLMAELETAGETIPRADAAR